MYTTPATLLCDFYKISHREQYDESTEQIYSTWTARNSRIKNIKKVVVFGFQGFIKKYLIKFFNDHFFNRLLTDVIDEYQRVIKYTLNIENPSVQHLIDLHNLGYLPLLLEAVPEGTQLPIRVPCLTIRNTDSRFFWLTNFVETLFSCEAWLPTNSATLAHGYYEDLNKWADKTCDNNEHVKYQGHDFSMRGMGCLEAACLSGAGHLLSFVGTDTIPAICYLESYYNANIENELVGTSIPASEHSVVCCNGQDEISTLRRLLTEVYPSGFFSYVADTWNLWDNLTKTLPALKDEIMNRDGKLVIRPDSGNPVDIICGKQLSHGERWTEGMQGDYHEQELKGVIELLWDVFGGTINEKGYKVLDSHIGAIYGDAITRERANDICERLAAKGFASSNIVFGIGSFTYQYNTRDTFGFALKSTYALKDGQEVFLFKDPITDDGIKKSQKGLVMVQRDAEGNIQYIDELGLNEYINKALESGNNLLRPIFLDGNLLIDEDLQTIRDRVNSEG